MRIKHERKEAAAPLPQIDMIRVTRALNNIATNQDLADSKQYLTNIIPKMSQSEKQEFMSMVYDSIFDNPEKAKSIKDVFPKNSEENSILKDIIFQVERMSHATRALNQIAESNGQSFEEAKQYLTTTIPKMTNSEKEKFMDMAYNTILAAPDRANAIVDLFPAGNDKNIRLLSKLASGREFEEGSEHRTGAYTEVREDSSTEPTYKLPAEVEFRKKSIINQHAQGVITSKVEKISESLNNPAFQGRENLQTHLKELQNNNGALDKIVEDSSANIGKIFGRVSDADLIKKMFTNLTDGKEVLSDINTEGYRITIKNSNQKGR